MKQRMTNPATLLPEAMPAIQALMGATYKGGVSPVILSLSHLRASQINGCEACIVGGISHAKQRGETDERLGAVEDWHSSKVFTDEERAALALTESVTRLSDQADPVPDSIWDEATRHFDEKGLAALVLSIGITNLFNRMNVATRQEPGQW